MASTTLSDNSFQSPTNTETGGATWHKVEDPTVGYIAQDLSPTADSFTGGLEVDFSSVVPAGTKAVRCAVVLAGSALAVVYYRASGDTNIANTPVASTEHSHLIGAVYNTSAGTRVQAVMWLSSDYKVQIAAESASTDIYVAYPVEYLL